MDTPLSWLEDVQRSFRCGATAVLCIGSVGDGFPRPCLAELEHMDVLLRWEDVVCDAFANGEMVVVFDVARGFTFPREDDHKRFVKIFEKTQGTQQDVNDPIAKQRRQMMQQQDLPRNPQAALPILQQVLALCPQEKPPVPCLLILPDADALCPSSEGNAMAGVSATISLALIQLAGSPVFRSAGHRILMSTPAIQAVDERLRRHDAPFKVIRVARPSEAERKMFLARITESDDLAKQIRQSQLEHAALISKEESRLRIEMGKRREILARMDQDLGANPQMQDALAKSHALFVTLHAENAKDALRIARETNETQKALLDLKVRRDQDPSLQFGAITPQNWKTIKKGGWLSTNAGRPMRVWEIYSNGEISLERADRPGEVFMSTEGEPIRIKMNADRSVTRRASAKPGGKESTSQAVLTYGSHEAKTLADEISVIETDVRNFPPSESVVCARQAYDESVAKCDALRVVLDKQLAKERKDIEMEIAELEKQFENPSNADIVAKQQWIKRLEKEMARQGDVPSRFPKPKEGIEEIARLCQGLGYRDLLEIFLSARADERVVTTGEVLSARIKILRRTYGHLMDIVDPAYGFEGIAGLDHIKSFFAHVRDWIQSGDARRVPMGCLLIGPPGTGKTAIAEAFAHECGVLFVKIRNVRTMWVGETERKMEETFAAMRSLAPIVVLRDEVDEEDSGRDAFQGDSGVSARLRRGWMEFLSDPKIRGKIFVISCSNRPDRLDAALIRSGRTDERIPLLMPDDATRRDLFPVMLRRYGYESDVTDFGRLAATTDGWSGADIEVIVRLAAQRSLEDGREIVSEADFDQAVGDFLPAASQEQIAKMTLAAIKYTSSRRWLPQGYETIATHCERVLRGEKIPKTPPARPVRLM
ncbi:MAG: AAA ATPase central domain protein [Candidatus Uhrbacteria bacterium GW2011_GWE2_46_68]|uniref:AAA ATPase central domain protein n=2 Tax=Candidatus Uhriibacteriota TaxID=1752732 RepID=A0A0G1SGK8_9BACT|nr:MAG: AAA ATPase central domain protein [Candidatus Uhrbacteria bacterium GW2011_GWF2_46_218]KKU41208.1 MAG: AAA ATPase central domain protein [Candidatus Uhrbacteria bacterium GW2011_GWE2_46_68]